jgi:Ni2+-binding GTPase involved in maturation of urease and hydrogenase
LENLRLNIQSVNPDAAIIEMSAHEGTGLDRWIEVLKNRTGM